MEDETEFVLVGLCISTAISSYEYWNGVGREKFSKIFVADSIVIKADRNYPRSAAKEDSSGINLAKVGGADVAGAVGGAIDGAALGPGGSLAVGVLGAAVSSSYNAINQKLDGKFSWWPF